MENCILFRSESALAAVNVRGELQFFTPVISCGFSSVVRAEIPAFDCMRHTFSAEWILSDVAERIKYTPSASFPAPEELAVTALAEGLLKGFDVSAYITEKLNGKLNSLKKFLGDYKEVIYMGENIAGLAYERAKNSLLVVPFKGVFSEGKIDSLTEYEGEGDFL